MKFFYLRNDELFFLIEREVTILKSLYELEFSYVDVSNTQEFNSLKSFDRFLMLNFKIENLQILSTFLHKATQGPIGVYFLRERRNFFYDICELIWEKYLKTLLSKIDYFYDIELELEEAEHNLIKERLMVIMNPLYFILFNTHSVLSKIENKDVILYSILASRLADFAESTEKFSEGANSLHNTLEYINSHKEKTFKFGVSTEINYHSFNTFTCDNNKIFNLHCTVQNKYEENVQKLNLKRRKQVNNMFI